MLQRWINNVLKGFSFILHKISNLIFQLVILYNRGMDRMAESMWLIMDTDCSPDKLVDTYWILCGLFDQVYKFHGEIGKLQECTYTILEKEDPNLYQHLVKIDSLQSLPYDVWFYSCFASTIGEGSIPKYDQFYTFDPIRIIRNYAFAIRFRIWDKIAVGAHKILVFVAVITLTTVRRLLLKSENIDNVLETISNVKVCIYIKIKTLQRNFNQFFFR